MKRIHSSKGSGQSTEDDFPAYYLVVCQLMLTHMLLPDILRVCQMAALELMRRFQPLGRSDVLTGDERADDAVMETVGSLTKTMNKPNNHVPTEAGEFYAYVRTAVFYNMYPKQKQVQVISMTTWTADTDDGELLVWEVADPAPLPEMVAVSDAVMDTALAHFSEAEAHAFHMRMNGHTRKEVIEATGLTIGQLRGSERRLRGRLEEHLE